MDWSSSPTRKIRLSGAASRRAMRSWLASTSWTSSTSKCAHRDRQRARSAASSSRRRSASATRSSQSSTAPGATPSGASAGSRRARSSSAARVLKVIAAIEAGTASPAPTSQATRATSVVVLPLPAGATHRMGPGGAVAASREAATAPPGPILCVAPAGSGKTTTLVARVAWLVGAGEAVPASIAAITFNTRAAEGLRARLDPALAPLGVAPGAVRVRTFHALGLEILRDAGVRPELRARDAILRRACPDLDAAARRRLDSAFSRLKLDLAVTAGDVARDPAPGPVARAFLAYEKELGKAAGIDFDDLVALALRRLEEDAALLARWRSRCAHLLVDEVQDVDASQLRMALLLAAPDNRIFLVGDDDQSIFGWRLADVRRVLGLAGALPGLRRVDLEVNYRCPAPVVAAAVRLVEQNAERFAKRVRPRPDASGRLILAPAPTARDPAAEMGIAARAIDGWPADDGTRAILARTRRELLPAAALALERGVPFRADGVTLLLDDPRLDGILAAAAAVPGTIPLLLCLVATTATRRGSAPPCGSPVAGEPAGRPPTDAPELDDLGPEMPPLTDLL